MDHIVSSYPEAGSSHNGSRYSEVIREIQLLPKITNQGRMHKDFMTNIGQDSPNTSMKSRGVKSNEQN